MIRKYGHIDAPVELVRSIFSDPEGWPLWFPGVERITIVSRTDDRFQMDVDGRYMGRRMQGRIECILEPDRLIQRQLSGWPKKWLTHWRFLTPPDGRGTTLGCEVDLDLGLLGVVTPNRMVRAFVDRVFADTVYQVGRRALELHTEERVAAPSKAEETPLLQMYETAAGLEVWIGGRRYLLETSE